MMMSSTLLSDGITSWVKLALSHVSAQGQVLPRLVVSLEASATRERIEAEIHHLTGELFHDRELLGKGALPPAVVSSFGTQLTLEVPVARDALHFVQQTLRGDAVDLRLEFTGLLRVRHDLPQGEQYRPSSPPQGEWGFVAIGQGRHAELRFQISRSDWFKRVLEPTGVNDYLLAEIRIPKAHRGQGWRNALDHLHDAERHFIIGNDAEVFFKCRAALEALPGAPKRTFDFIGNATKRQRIDELAKQFVDYLHTGRHVERSPGEQGKFPVDRRDAEFALALTKVMLAYASSLKE